MTYRLDSTTQIVIIVLIVLIVAAWIFLTYHPKHPEYIADPRKNRTHDLLEKMNRLWVERAYLMRMAITEAINEPLHAPITIEKLNNNINSISRNFSNLYGNAEGDKLGALLHQQNEIIMKYLTTARQNKTTDALLTQWQNNSQDLANFLSSVNPSFDVKTIQTLLDSSMTSLNKEIYSTIRQENLASMNAFEAYLKNTNELSSLLQNGTWTHVIGPGPRYI